MNDWDDIKSLDEELILVQLRKREKELLKKIDLKDKLKLLLLIIGVSFVSGVAIVAIPSPITLYVVGGIVLTTGVTMAGVNLIKLGLDFRKRREKTMAALLELKESENLDKINFDEKMIFEEVKKQKLGLASEEDFYSEKMQNYIATEENKEESKYEKVLRIQNNKSNIRLYNPKEQVSNSKDDVINKIMYELDAYCLGLILPPMEISNNEWQIYFDTLYDAFSQNGATDDYYNAVSRLCRITLSNSLVNKSEYISIKDFIDSVEYLDKKFSFFDISLSKGEVTALQNMLNEKINSEKIITLNISKKK